MTERAVLVGRFGPIADVLADVLSSFSLDLVSVVSSYLLCGIATPDIHPRVLYLWQPQHGLGVMTHRCGAVAVNPADDNVWLACGEQIFVYGTDEKLISQWKATKSTQCIAFSPVPKSAEAQQAVYLSHVNDHSLSVYNLTGICESMRHFEDIQGVAVTANGFLRVVSQRMACVATPNGILKIFGSRGRGDGQFMTPCAVAVSSTGETAVSDLWCQRVSVFDAKCNFILSFGKPGRAPGEFNHPTSLAYDRCDNIFVCDGFNYRIQVFNPDGEFITEFGERMFTQIDGGHFRDVPVALALGGDGRVYVAEGARVHVFAFIA